MSDAPKPPTVVEGETSHGVGVGSDPVGEAEVATEVEAAFDGIEVDAPIVGIVMGSTLKGVLAGLIIGLVAQRTQSLTIGITVGLIVGAGLAALVTMGGPYFWEIVLPGAVVGLIVGYATFKYRGPTPARG